MGNYLYHSIIIIEFHNDYRREFNNFLGIAVKLNIIKKQHLIPSRRQSLLNDLKEKGKLVY